MSPRYALDLQEDAFEFTALLDHSKDGGKNISDKPEQWPGAGNSGSVAENSSSVWAKELAFRPNSLD